MANKYGNKKAVRNGITFDSQKEAARYDQLMLLVCAGEIRDLKLQPEFTLQEAFTTPLGERVRAIRYRADFSYERPTEPDCTGTVHWLCALPGFVDSKNEEKTERNAGYLVVSHSGGGMLRQGTRKGIRRTPANRGMRAHWVVKGLDISEDVCHGLCP